MKLRFRIPEEDEDENENAAQTHDEPDLGELAPKVLAVALAAGATQVLWPLPLPFLLAFSLVGAAAGVAWLLRITEAAPAAGILLCWGIDFFTPSLVDFSFVIRTTFVAIAGFGLTVGVGLRIQRSQGQNAAK